MINSPANSTRLILCCQVSSASNVPHFSIQWHHSPTFPNAVSIVNDTVTMFDPDQTEMKENIILSKKIVWSKLTVDDKGDDGYYWCSVNTNNSDISNPSTVVNISFLNGTQIQTCNCGDGPVQNVSKRFSKLRCAENNVSITKSDTQSDLCLQDDDDKHPQLTTAPEDYMMITTLPEIDTEIDKTNESATQESLTTLPKPTEVSSNDESTNHAGNVEITTKTAYEDVTETTNTADTEWLTTAEASRRDQLDRIMMSFTVGTLKPPDPPPSQNMLPTCMNVLVFCSQV